MLLGRYWSLRAGLHDLSAGGSPGRLHRLYSTLSSAGEVSAKAPGMHMYDDKMLWWTLLDERTHVLLNSRGRMSRARRLLLPGPRGPCGPCSGPPQQGGPDVGDNPMTLPGFTAESGQVLNRLFTGRGRYNR